MKLVADRDVLHKALGTVAGVVPQRSTKPILQNVLIDARGDGKVELLATDLEVGIRATFEATDTKAGKAVLSAARLVGLLRDAPSGEVVLETKDDRAKLTAGGEFTLVGSPPDEFPEVPAFDEVTVTVDAAEFAKVLSRVQFAASKEQTRYAINGVSMQCKGKEMEFAATDGRRLAVARAKIGGKKKAPSSSAILPIKMVSELIKLSGGRESRTGEEEEEKKSAKPAVVELQLAGNELLARTAEVTLAGRLVEGSFPRYEEVVPTASDKKLTISAAKLTRALRQAIVMTTDESRSVKFSLGPGKQTLEAKTPEIGTASIALDGTYEGDELAVAFNPAFVAEGLRVLDADEVAIEFEAADRPLLVREGKEYTYVVMPVKL